MSENIDTQVSNVETEKDLIYSVKFTGWVTFIGILNIIGGALTSIGIITAIIGVPMIIAGVKLVTAVDNMKKFINFKDKTKYVQSIRDINTYFTINGIIFIVVIAIYLIVFLVLIATGFNNFFNMKHL